MENKGVLCNVGECAFNRECEKCTLDTIEVSCEKTSANSIPDPHFCKSYRRK